MRVKYRFLLSDDIGGDAICVSECKGIYMCDDNTFVIQLLLEDEVISMKPIFESDYKYITDEVLTKGYCDLTKYGIFKYRNDDKEEDEVDMNDFTSDFKYD